MGGAILSKPLIQFSVDGWGCVPSLLFIWGQTMVEVMKIMATFFKRSHAGTATFIYMCMHTHVCINTGTATFSAPTLQQATTDPCLIWRLLDTHGQVWVSPLWGHCFFLLGPRVQKVLFVPSKSLFPQSCVSSGGSMVGFMATSSKRAYAISRSAA